VICKSVRILDEDRGEFNSRSRSVRPDNLEENRSSPIQRNIYYIG
jgi:hypothetical protein